MPNNNQIRITLEEHLERIRRYYAENKRAPNGDDMPSGTRKNLTKKYGSWHAALHAALGFNAAYHKMKIVTNDELAVMIVKLRDSLKRTPLIEELPHLKVMVKRFGGPNEAMEYAIQISPRIEVLSALDRLTIPTCNDASNSEIKSETDKRGCNFSVHHIDSILTRAMHKGFVVYKKYDRTRTWILTPEGKKFLENFKGGKNGKNRTQ